MKLHNLTYILSPFFFWFGPAVVTHGYIMPGGGGMFCGPNRMMTMTPAQRAEFRRQQAEFVNRAFDSLANELNKETAANANAAAASKRPEKTKSSQHDGGDDNDDTKSGQERQQKDRPRQQLQQEEWMENAFDFASELFKELGDDDNAKQFRDFANRGMGIAKDAMRGTYSPAYEINESDSMFEISIDLPGVEKSKIDISIEEQLLTVSGERDMGREAAKAVPFSKSFHLDKSVDTEKITASLDSGVLLIRALKKKEEKAPGKRIPIL